ncbi:hypothetical protein KI387_028713, partial [Taxus chinensis]
MIDLGEAGKDGIVEGIDAKDLSLRSLSFLNLSIRRGDWAKDGFLELYILPPHVP